MKARLELQIIARYGRVLEVLIIFVVCIDLAARVGRVLLLPRVLLRVRKSVKMVVSVSTISAVPSLICAKIVMLSVVFFDFGSIFTVSYVKTVHFVVFIVVHEQGGAGWVAAYFFAVQIKRIRDLLRQELTILQHSRCILSAIRSAAVLPITAHDIRLLLPSVCTLFLSF